MTSEHTLRIRCPTWGHLENFYAVRVKNENLLLARVPFSPSKGSVVTIALEFPDGLVVDIDADVEAVHKAPDSKKSAIRVVLRHMDGGRIASPGACCSNGAKRYGGRRVRHAGVAVRAADEDRAPGSHSLRRANR
ncbi:MAG: hypothetical protein GY811_12105 [Myxococcales bacterium]|nr:hypothetical protein [Myxococcales bacterium]